MKKTARSLPRFLTTRQAARLLGLSNLTMYRYRARGDGPPFHMFERRCRYAEDDLEEWARARRMTSTSDSGCHSKKGKTA